MTTEKLLIEIPAQHAAELRAFAAARGGRAEPWNIILGKHGYLSTDEAYDHASLCRAAAQSLNLPQPAWSSLSPDQRTRLAQLGADDWSFMNEGRFEPEAAAELREILTPG